MLHLSQPCGQPGSSFRRHAISRCSPSTRPSLGLDDVRVRVAGCGVCHTDIGFYTGQVRTRHALPARPRPRDRRHGRRRAPPPHAHLIGRDVIVPAVIPCDACELCRTGHDNACLNQIMPGNHTHGGFATEIVVPARHLVPLGADRGGYDARRSRRRRRRGDDAVSGARARRGAPGDLVIVIGAGGIGTYAVQIAKARGASVAVIDIDPAQAGTAGAVRRGLAVQRARDGRRRDQEAPAGRIAARAGRSSR